MLLTRVGLRSTTLRGCPLGYIKASAFTEITCATAATSRPSRNAAEDGKDGSTKDVKVDALFFLDSMFPIRLGTWDLRYYMAAFRKETLVERLEAIFTEVRVHNFEVQSVEPRMKDGGVFIHFRYSPQDVSEIGILRAPRTASATTTALATIKQTLTEHMVSKGGLPSWLGMKHGNLWEVRGTPWQEDMRRFASSILRVSFEGPDVCDEQIWKTLRPYGRIRDLQSSGQIPGKTLRSALVTFERTTSATIAHNCIYGAYVPVSVTGTDSLTRLITTYERPIKARLIRDWLASHPRIVFPVVVFLLGTLTYTIFDPIRAFAVQAKFMRWLDYRKFALTKWLCRNTFDRLAQVSDMSQEPHSIWTDTRVWKDRREAETTIDSYLSDYPSTITFVHGPAGSGKSRLLHSVLERSDRRAMLIDCAEIYAGGSDAAMISSLAKQTGYWPVFTFLNTINNLIDLASMGSIGQKAGLSSSLEDQVIQILEVVASGLRRVSGSRRKETEDHIKRAQCREKEEVADNERRERILSGIWHDGRIECVSGIGIISELGVGIEHFGDEDKEYQERHEDKGRHADMAKLSNSNDKLSQEREYRCEQDVGSLPVVIIKNFGTDAKPGKMEVLDLLAEWAAVLVSNRIAHVVVVSHNRENVKRLAKALPTKPLNTVTLTDADPASSLSYINQKLNEASVEYNISSEQIQLIERLGGRASDLETIIHKIRAGQSVVDAVEDIIQRGVSELRKNAFGDDSEDAKGLAWTRQQAWTVLKVLAQKDEVPYYQLLLEFPFTGDEIPLRAMEHAEMISITTQDGRPCTIRPGKPIHRYVFQRLLADKVFKTTQDMAFNELLMSGLESRIKSAESELVVLKDILSGPERYSSVVSQVTTRASYLTNKMLEAQQKLVKLEKENAGLKKVLNGEPEDKAHNKLRGWPFLW